MCHLHWLGISPPPPQGALSSLQQRSTHEVEERHAELKRTRERLHKEIDGVFDYMCEPGSMAMCVHVCVASALLMTVVLHHVDLREEVSQTEATLQAKSRELQVLQHYKVRLNGLCPQL